MEQNTNVTNVLSKLIELTTTVATATTTTTTIRAHSDGINGNGTSDDLNDSIYSVEHLYTYSLMIGIPIVFLGLLCVLLARCRNIPFEYQSECYKCSTCKKHDSKKCIGEIIKCKQCKSCKSCKKCNKFEKCNKILPLSVNDKLPHMDNLNIINVRSTNHNNISPIPRVNVVI